MQERGPDPKGGHRCYKWGHEPDRNAIVCASTGVMGLAEVGLTSGRGAASRNSQGSSGKQPTKRLFSGYFSDSNCLGGYNWQLGIELVIIIYRVVRNRGKCLMRLHIKKTHTITNQCCCYYIIYIIYIKYIIYKSLPSLSLHNVFITSGVMPAPSHGHRSAHAESLGLPV